MSECKYCGKSGLRWSNDTGGWRLMTAAGRLHDCDSAEDDDEGRSTWAKAPATPAEPTRIAVRGLKERADEDLDFVCEHCRFWEPVGDKTRGECRRYAPHPLPSATGAQNVGCCWRTTRKDEWCGECEAFDPNEADTEEAF